MTPQPLPAGSWSLDPNGTTITVSAKKLGFINVPASADLTSGTIVIGDDGTVQTVDVVVDAGSYASPNAKRNEHVLGADFLDAETHPTIEFHSTSVAPAGSGWRADGTLQVKGVSSPLSVGITDLDLGAARSTFTVTASIDRSAAGVGKMPALVIGNTIELTAAAAATPTEG